MSASADNIATFVEVVRHQSLSAAARSLGLPKSTVSRRLQRLEDELHGKLLHRDARKISLTAAGRSFYEAVAGAIDTLDAAVATQEHSSQAPRGLIRMTVPPDLGRMLLARMFVAFLERQPDITLDVLFTNRIVDLAQEGVDLAVRASRMIKGDLIARTLCESGLELAASSKRRAHKPANDDIGSLAQLPFVLHRAPGGSQSIQLQRGSGKSIKRVEFSVSGRISVDDYAAMAELVSAGQGVGLMPSIHVRDGVQAGRLVRLFPDWSSRTGNVYLVYPSRQQPARVRLLTDYLVESFANMPSV